MKRIQGTSGNATLAFYFVFILFFFIFAATFEGFSHETLQEFI